jgi:hypothetical protein
MTERMAADIPARSVRTHSESFVCGDECLYKFHSELFEIDQRQLFQCSMAPKTAPICLGTSSWNKAGTAINPRDSGENLNDFSRYCDPAALVGFDHLCSICWLQVHSACDPKLSRMHRYASPADRINVCKKGPCRSCSGVGGFLVVI